MQLELQKLKDEEELESQRALHETELLRIAVSDHRKLTVLTELLGKPFHTSDTTYLLCRSTSTN
jgi:hypothetical protein